MLSILVAFIYVIRISIEWLSLGQIRFMNPIDNTTCLYTLMFFVYLTLHIFGSILLDNLKEIRAFKALPIYQVGLFTVQNSIFRSGKTLFCLLVECIVACIIYECATKGINVTGTVGDTQYFPVGPIWMIHLVGMTLMILYILYNERYVHKEILLRTSILYTIQRHPFITFHNARHFCEQFSLRGFPVKIFERLHHEKPNTTLFDLEKVVRKAQRHVTFMEELSDTYSHLRYIEQPVLPSSQ